MPVERAAEQVGVGHVVAVADVDEAHARELAETLSDGEQVGEALTRVMVVGERVDDRDCATLGHLLDHRLRRRCASRWRRRSAP